MPPAQIAPNTDRPDTDQPETWPRIRLAGFDGFLVSFGDRLSEPANRAALAFRAAIDAAIEAAQWSAVEETSTSLVSTYIRFDTRGADHARMRAALDDLLGQRDWYGAELPAGRRLWRVPTVFGTAMAPQLDEAAAAAGMSAEQAIEQISGTRVRVQTIGFAPGQPYLGSLPPAWDIPRQTALTDRVPVGALTVAIRQLVLFSVSTPTGWRHIGQTALRLFRPDAADPFLLRPGDEVIFQPTAPETLARITGDDGGATREAIR